MGFDRRETHSFLAATALTRYAVVKPNATADTVAYASAGETENLWVTENAVASGGTVTCRPLASPGGTFKLQAAGAVALGAKVGVTGAVGRVDDAGIGGIAIALEAATTAGEEFLCAPAAPGGATTQAQAALGTALTNSTTETSLGSKTLNGASFSVGDVIEVVAIVDVTATNSTDTLALDLMFGTEVILALAALDVADNDIAHIHAYITVEAVGASGTIRAAGLYSYDAPGTLKTSFIKDSATEDMSGDVVVKVDGTWSVASAANSCNLQTLVVTHHRA